MIRSLRYQLAGRPVASTQRANEAAVCEKDSLSRALKIVHKIIAHPVLLATFCTLKPKTMVTIARKLLVGQSTLQR